MTKSLKVLLVEDRPEDAELLVREMQSRGLEFSSRRVETRVEFEEALETFCPDLILSDYTLPCFHGTEALEIANRKRPNAPFIFVSGTIGDERAIEALKRGAVDYVLKDNRARLVPAIQRAVRDIEERDAKRWAQRKLEESEERFRTIAEATQEWIWEIDAEGIYTFSSPAVESILGLQADQVVGKSCLEIVAPNTRRTVADLLNRSLTEKRGWRDQVLHFKHAAGGIRWVDNTALPMFDAQGSVVGHRGVARDITQRRLQQERIARLSRIQAVLTAINSTIVRVRDRRQLLREACRTAVQQGGFKMAWIGLVKPGELKANPLVWEGFEQGLLTEIARELAAVAEDPGPVGQALRLKKMVVVNDIEADPNAAFKREALTRGFRSQMAMPLIVDEQPLGVLVLYAAEPGFFDYEELKLLKDLGGDISFALDYIEKQERLNYVSYYDALTGLANRQLFFDRLAQGLHVARSERRDLAVMLIDLERFKHINDTLGRYAGDQVLKELARRLRRTVSESATPARIGGDRFAVVVPNLPETSLGRWVEEWIVAPFAAPLNVDDIELHTNVKIGIAFYSVDADDDADTGSAEGLFMNAEAALKRAKHGAAQYLFYSPEMNVRIAQRLHLESRLGRAVANKEFTLHYQVRVDIGTRAVRGLEALIRWQDSDYGAVPPLEFVPLLEESGMIVEVGRWVIEQAIADIGVWRAQRLRVPRVAVNVSEVQLRQPNFVATVLAALGPPQNHATGLDIEITESMLAQDSAANVQKLSQLRQAGVQIFMDDFGTGYSGLSQIAQLPLDAVKIDRAFVAGMSGSAEHMAIVSTIINLTRALGISVVAEGVETEEQAQKLKFLGCAEGQGYLFGRPMPADEIAALLSSNH
jgi:diguanylate cyclase (GGDEF)-like protein/PAS domain S-box-containing protein